MRKAKVFISSSAQQQLQKVREISANAIEKLGHEPVLYEYPTFAVWNIDDSISTCLNMVREADIFLLYISDKAGTYVDKHDATVTHMEFLAAYEFRKHPMVFVESHVKKVYFSEMRWKIVEQIAAFQEREHRYPSSIYKEVVLPMKEQGQLPEGIEPYIWVFLHDLIHEKNVYAEDIDIGVGVAKPLELHLSQLLAESVKLLPNRALFAINSDQANRYIEYKDLAREMLARVHQGLILPEDWDEILPVLRKKLKGGKVNKQKSGLVHSEVATYRDCSGITLFQKQGKLMKRIS